MPPKTLPANSIQKLGETLGASTNKIQYNRPTFITRSLLLTKLNNLSFLGGIWGDFVYYSEFVQSILLCIFVFDKKKHQI